MTTLRLRMVEVDTSVTLHRVAAFRPAKDDLRFALHGDIRGMMFEICTIARCTRNCMRWSDGEHTHDIVILQSREMHMIFVRWRGNRFSLAVDTVVVLVLMRGSESLMLAR